MPAALPAPCRQRGAALLMLLVVLSLGTAALMLQWFGGGADDRARSARTLSAMAAAREALIGYATVHGRLPRPAISAIDGHERAACATEQDCTGILPWVTLGIDGVDSWGRMLRYSASPDYTRAPIVAGRAAATKRVSGRDGAGVAFYQTGEAACVAGGSCSPAVIFSSGKNGPGLSALGAAQPGSGRDGVDELANHTGATDFFNRPAGAAPAGGEFDDLLIWLPVKTLRLRMYAAGVLY